MLETIWVIQDIRWVFHYPKVPETLSSRQAIMKLCPQGEGHATRQEGFMFKEDISVIRLTNRETEVLYLVSCGLSAKEAAIELDISPCTVERHVENVRLKTRTRNRAHMIAHVIREGLLNQDPQPSYAP